MKKTPLARFLLEQQHHFHNTIVANAHSQLKKYFSRTAARPSSGSKSSKDRNRQITIDNIKLVNAINKITHRKRPRSSICNKSQRNSTVLPNNNTDNIKLAKRILSARPTIPDKSTIKLRRKQHCQLLTLLKSEKKAPVSVSFSLPRSRRARLQQLRQDRYKELQGNKLIQDQLKQD